MKKTALLTLTVLVFSAISPAGAQLAFWNYDDANSESQIPAECDGVFDDSRGGVFMPTSVEMAEHGEEFLLNTDPVERNKAGYCLIAAALLGHVDSQYRVAQLYNKGIVLPQDDLSAYRWAFLASLNGHEEAGKLALLLERFLTTEEIELATRSVQAMLPSIGNKYKAVIAEQQKRIDAKQQELDKINDEIDTMLGIKTQSAKTETPAEPKQAGQVVPTGAIFSNADRI